METAFDSERNELKWEGNVTWMCFTKLHIPLQLLSLILSVVIVDVININNWPYPHRKNSVTDNKHLNVS